LIGLALRFLGDLTGAQRHIKRMLDRYVAPAHGSYIIRFGFDQQVAAGTALAPLLWLRGFPNQAMRAVETNIDHARAIGHALSLCNALAQSACPVAFLTGDLAAAERFVTMLLDTAAMHGLSNWHGLGRCFEGMLVVKRGDVAGGLSLLRVGLDALRAFRTSGFHKVVLCDLADALGRAGAIAEGLAVVDEALARSERTEERWCSAELLRTNGNLILQHAAPNAAAAAEEHFERSLDWARRQEALSWELRTATSFARLRRDQGRPSEGRDLLASVYGRFSEGFATADLKAAKGLLDALA
jgi:predicted ATPase